MFRLIDGELTEAGCESYETSEDGLTWTFHLRDNKYSDGEDVKAQDYVNSIRRIFDPEVNCHNAGIFYCIAGGEAFNTGAGAKEDVGAVAVDDKTLQITLVEPIPVFCTAADICKRNTGAGIQDRRRQKLLLRRNSRRTFPVWTVLCKRMDKRIQSSSSEK